MKKFIAKEGTWFKAGTECIRAEKIWEFGTLTSESGEKTGSAIYEGIYVVGSDNGSPNDTRWHAQGYRDGDEIVMREHCTDDEFIVINDDSAA